MRVPHDHQELVEVNTKRSIDSIAKHFLDPNGPQVALHVSAEEAYLLITPFKKNDAPIEKATFPM